jgi:dethiobiotin synthetase
VVIAGTDTGVGKTWVGCRLAEALRLRGDVVRAIKLVETGTGPEPNEAEDGVLLAKAAAQLEPTRALRRYRAPLAPPLAAELDGESFDPRDLWRSAMELAAPADRALIEGAGGLMAPLDWQLSLLDLLAADPHPVLLVAADRLGTLNHTLLTLEALGASDVPLLGVVINRLQDGTAEDRSRGQNAAALARLRPALRITSSVDADWLPTVLSWLRA